MNHKSVAIMGAIVIATAMVVLAFIVAPRACEGGLDLYFWCGCAALLVLICLPFVSRMGRSKLARVAFALGFVVFGAGAWLVGLVAANVRFICGLGYL